MASCSTVACGVCDSQHTTTNAEYWCPECDEGLCSQCLKYHNASKALRNHDVISVDNYKELPPSIANISTYCTQHERKFQNYCSQHADICCPQCVQSNHANCVGILSLENVIQTAKTSVLLETIDQNLRDIKINIERVVKDRTQNLVEIKKQKQKFHDEIKQVRNQINEHLDNLEQQILQDLHAAEDRIKSQIDDQLGKLTEHMEKLDLLQTNMSALREYASDLQTFLGSKMIETEIKKHELFMQSLYKDDSLQKIDLNCKIEDKISDILSTVSSFGSISVDASSPLVELQTEKDKQAQIRTFSHVPPTSINDIKITLKSKLEFSYVTGCAFSSNGDIFMVSYAKHCLLVLNGVGTLQSKLPLSYPLDVTCIDDKTVAVTFPNSNQIQIINFSSKTIERTIKTTSNCFGISYRDDHLYFNTGSGIQKVNVSGNCSPTLIKKDTLSPWCFITTSTDKIFYTNHSHSIVTCCSLTGEKIWEYKDQLVCNYPRGIAVDKDSNVYIATQVNSSIFVLSSDGKKARKLLGRYNQLSSSNVLMDSRLMLRKNFC